MHYGNREWYFKNHNEVWLKYSSANEAKLRKRRWMYDFDKHCHETCGTHPAEL